jgi:hypothetical protein
MTLAWHQLVAALPTISDRFHLFNGTCTMRHVAQRQAFKASCCPTVTNTGNHTGNTTKYSIATHTHTLISS